MAAGRLPMVLRVSTAAVSASCGVVVRRSMRGPTLPAWTWSEELLVGVSRAVLMASAPSIGVVAPRIGGAKPPIARSVRAALAVEPVDLGGVPAERYRPKRDPSGTILYFHGGGFVTGNVNKARRSAAAQAVAANCDTFSIEYRLAPKHPFPAALDDAVAAYRSLLERGVDPARVIFMGGSAGACLALSALLQIRELDLPFPAGAALLWPYADFTFSGETIISNGDIDMLPVRDLAHIWGPAYVGDADPFDPLVSPALAELTGLPPLLIVAGGADSLLSCAEQIATNARHANVETQFSVYPQRVHQWTLLSNLPSTEAAANEITNWISARLGSPS